MEAKHFLRERTLLACVSGLWRAFGLRARSTAGGGRPGTRTVPPQAHVSPPTRPGPSLQLVRSRFAGFSKVDPFHSLKVG